jgi:hypothetical protein
VLIPVLPQEKDGTVANVVFPTGIDRRDDLGTPDRFDIYYGMADNRIGVARLDLPDYLPMGTDADAPEAQARSGSPRELTISNASVFASIEGYQAALRSLLSVNRRYANDFYRAFGVASDRFCDAS